jgi:hypothetical protein
MYFLLPPCKLHTNQAKDKIVPVFDLSTIPRKHECYPLKLQDRTYEFYISLTNSILISTVPFISEALPPSHTVGSVGSFPKGKVGQGMKLNTHLHLILRLKMYGAIRTLPHMPSWYAQ